MTRAIGSRPRINPATNSHLGQVLNSRALDSYFKRSESPLYSLVFLLPMLALFEIGTYFYPSDPIAFRLLQVLFTRFGASGRLIPAIFLIVILLGWHIARKDAWRVRLRTLWRMGLESFALSLPLLALGMSFARWNIHVPLWGGAQVWRDETILSLGAGIYEELVFRLVMMTLLTVLLADILKFTGFWSGLLIVLISAVMFSLYHYLGYETFQWRSFTFRTAAGVYFGVLFLTRGFGITSGCHIAYDVLIVALQAWASH
jgi:hypothetical protein